MHIKTIHIDIHHAEEMRKCMYVYTSTAYFLRAFWASKNVELEEDFS